MNSVVYSFFYFSSFDSDECANLLELPASRFEVIQRPMSAAYSSHSTEMASHMSILPPADRFGLMKTAQAIYDSRQQICQALAGKTLGVNKKTFPNSFVGVVGNRIQLGRSD